MASETIATRLRRLRSERGLSVAALARAVSVTEAAVRNLESGESKAPSFSVGIRLADALGVDVHYLAFGETRSVEARLLDLERRLGALELRVQAIGTNAFPT